MNEADKLTPTEAWKNEREAFISRRFPDLQDELDAAIHSNHGAGVLSATIEQASGHRAYRVYRDLFYYAEAVYQQLGFDVERRQYDNSYFDTENACTVQPTWHRFELTVKWESEE